jgi:peptidoglycan/LPS O-acetylase OafA/YrhL
VRYLNLPKRFIAGAIYDPVQDECLEGAKVTLTDLTTNTTYSVQSDNYGDFWFEQIPVDHVYSVKIEMDGYYTKTFGAVYPGKDLNLGDIALYKM